MTDFDPPLLEVRTEFLFRIDIETNGERIERMNGTPYGGCINVAVAGGTVTGPKLNGTVLNMGGDWGLKTVQGRDKDLAVTDLDCTLMIKTDDGCLIQMSYAGVGYDIFPDPAKYEPSQPRDPGAYYFRTTPRFRTGAAKYDYLNRMVSVATGYHRASAGPIYDVHAVL